MYCIYTDTILKDTIHKYCILVYMCVSSMGVCVCIQYGCLCVYPVCVSVCVYSACVKACLCANRFSDDIEWMTGRRPNLYWQVTWRLLSPVMLLLVFLAYIVIEAETTPTYNAWNPDFVREVHVSNTTITYMHFYFLIVFCILHHCYLLLDL